MYGNTIVSNLKTPLNTTQRSSTHPIPIAATTAPRSVRATTIFPAFWTSIPSPSRPPSVSRHGPNFGPFFLGQRMKGFRMNLVCAMPVWLLQLICWGHSRKTLLAVKRWYEWWIVLWVYGVPMCSNPSTDLAEPFTPSGTDAGWDPWSRELHPGAPGAVWIMACRSEGWTQPSRQLRWTFEHSTCLVETNLPTP